MIGAIAMFFAVALGAFGAHGLKARVEPNLLSAFETGVRYQAYHGLGILMVALISLHRDNTWLRASGWMMLLGILLFSGSLYLMVLLDARWLGIVTPFGGLCFLLGWLCLGVAALRSGRQRHDSE